MGEGGLALFEGFSGASEHGMSVNLLGPEFKEVIAEFFENEAMVLGSKGVDDVVDTGFGDDEGMAVALAFGAFFSECEWVLTAIIGGLVANDVGMIALAEYEGGGVVECVFLIWGLVRFYGCCIVDGGTEKKVSAFAHGV